MICVNPELETELRQFGLDTSLSCFNCGTCAAICPLHEDNFPRRFVRYVQLGARDRILEAGPELWRCLHCGLCTATCPRGTDPGELMQVLKRFVLHHWRRN
ncbi:MAG: 4Fe-4S dicluster domain-containing protein [Desulfohalobiaceae bacterium]